MPAAGIVNVPYPQPKSTTSRQALVNPSFANICSGEKKLAHICSSGMPLSRIFIRPSAMSDALHGSIRHAATMPLPADFARLAAFCAVLFGVSLRNIRKKWIV
jgi:hypothetical protein